MSQLPSAPGPQPLVRGLRRPPAPPQLPMLWNMMRHRNDTSFYLLDLVRKHGDIFWMRLPKKDMYFVSNPTFIKHFLVDQGTMNYPKQPVVRGLVSGETVSTSSGEFWKRHRRMSQPLFHKERLLAQVPQIVAVMQRVLDRRWEPHLRSGEPMDVLREMSWALCSTMGQLVYSEDPQDDICDAVWHFMRGVIRPRPLLTELPLPLPRKLVRWQTLRRDPHLVTAAHRINDFSWETIRKRMAQSEQPDDMLGMLIDARDDKDVRMTEQEVRDEFVEFFYGGHLSTGLGLSWMLYCLSLHPEVAERTAGTVEQVLGGRAPTAEDLPALQYLNQVYSETLRLYPPSTGLERIAIKDDTIGGYDVPAGTHIFMDSFVMQRLPEYWKNPEVFDPEHFSEAQVKERPRFVYLPFGGGQRVCIGAMLSTTMAVLFSALVSQRYRLELVPGKQVTPVRGGAYYPENLWMRVLPA